MQTASDANSRRSPIWRPYTQEKTTPVSTRIARASGCFLYTDAGRKIFDGISSWWLNTHGHCHPQIVEAIQNQAAQVQQVTFGNFTHEPAEELAELLIQATPEKLKHVFFSDNGSTAVEVALKMALQACAQKGYSKKTRFLAFEKSYHGDTVGAMSVSGQNEYSTPYKSTLFNIIRARHTSESHRSVAEYVQDFERLIEAEHDTLAAVIVEPLIQGAGGMIFWPDAALRVITDLCRKRGVLIIFDEVMTGFGRTGRLFAMDRIGFAPDLLCLSKGLTGGSLPLAATLASGEIYDSFYSERRSKMLFHGHSFTGNAISCAAAVASMKLCLASDFVPKIDLISKIQHVEIAKLPSVVENARVLGTVAAFEICEMNARSVVDHAFSNGLFLRPLGQTLYMMPPYCASKLEIETAWAVLRQALDRHH